MMPAASRSLALFVTAVFALLGVVLYFARDWSARNFAWPISPFVAMTMGSWFLGGAYVAWRAVRIGSMSVVYPSLVFLGAFGVLELLVFLLHGSEIEFSGLLPPVYLIAVLAAVVAGAATLAAGFKDRGTAPAMGAVSPMALRILSGGFVLFAGYLGLRLLLGISRGGSIWPGNLNLVTARSFGAFYLALSLAVLPLIWSKTVAPILALLPSAAVGSVLITVPALVYIDQFDFDRQPGGLVYIGTYLFVLVVASAILIRNRLRPTSLPAGPEGSE